MEVNVIDFLTIGLIIGIVVAFGVGYFIRKSVAEGKTRNAEEAAKKIVEDAVKEGEAKQKELLFNAKEEAITIKESNEKDNRERRNELQKMENRLVQKEENLDRKNQNLERANEKLEKRNKELDKKQEKLNGMLDEKIKELEKISSLTFEEAKEMLLDEVAKETIDHEVEGNHVEIGVNVLKKHKENKSVIHAVEAHHGDVETTTIEAVLVQAADAISAARPGARRETLVSYVQRLEELEKIATSFDGVEKSYAIQAGREVRIMVKPDSINDDGMLLLSKDIAKKIEEEMEYPGNIKVNLIRETRAVEYAK